MLRKPAPILIETHYRLVDNFSINNLNSAIAALSTFGPQRSERKPIVTGITELKRRARKQSKERQEVREIPLRSPENVLLVKGLIPIAKKVLDARTELYHCVSRILENISVYACSVERFMLENFLTKFALVMLLEVCHRKSTTGGL